MNNAQIKRLARIRLAGNWGNCVALSMTLISFALMVFLGEVIIYNISLRLGMDHASYFDYVASPSGAAMLILRTVAYYLLFVPEFGNIRSIYISLSQGKSFLGTQWEIRHNSFRYYFKMIGAQTLSILYQVLLIAPIVLCSFSVTYYIDQCQSDMSMRNLLMFMLCLVITILMVCVFIFLRIKLQLMPYILIFRSDIGIIDAFILSSRLMKKNTIRYLFFQLSFIHYFALCVLVFPLLVVIPYYCMSVTVFCSSLATKQAIEDYLGSKSDKNEI